MMTRAISNGLSIPNPTSWLNNFARQPMVTTNGIKTGKFSEEFYFLIMSSPVRARVKSLAAKHDLSAIELRAAIVDYADRLSDRLQVSIPADRRPLELPGDER